MKYYPAIKDFSLYSSSELITLEIIDASCVLCLLGGND